MIAELPTDDQPKLPSVAAVATMIADRLNETGEPQRRQIYHIVWALGVVQAWALMMDALEIDEGDGLMLPDGSRRRTLGGIFFYLAFSKGVPATGKVLRRFPPQRPKTETASGPAPVIHFRWEDRIASIQESEQEKGQATVKVTIVGRPGKIVTQGQCIITVMESTKVPTVPKGVPLPPAAPTKFSVYIASKQWRKVSEAIADPDDVLIVEGYPTLDAKTNSIAVFASSVTTKKLQIALKTKQQQASA